MPTEKAPRLRVPHGTQMFVYDGRVWIAGGSSGQGGTGTGRRLVDLEVLRLTD